MAQDFERKIPFNSSGDIAIGTTARTVMTSNSDDTIIGIRLTNITNATIKANVYVTSTASGGSADSYLVYQQLLRKTTNVTTTTNYLVLLSIYKIRKTSQIDHLKGFKLELIKANLNILK